MMRRFVSARSHGPASAVALGSVAVLLAACAAPTSSSGGSSSTRVRIVLPHPTNFTVGLPYYIARDRGFFKKEHVTTKPTFTSGGGSNVQGVVAGNADMGVETGPGAIFSAVSHGAKLKIIGATTTGLDILFFAKKSSNDTSIDDLSGKKVGFSEAGSSSNVAVDQINAKLRSDGKKPAVGQAIGSPPAQLTAVQTGQIAAGWTEAPTFLDQVKSGKLRIVVDSRKEFPAYHDVAIRVAFASSSFASQHPKQVRGFLAAWHEAWQWIFAHHAQAIKLWKRDAKLKDKPAALDAAFDYFDNRTQRVAPLRGMRQNVTDAVTLGLIKKPLSSKQLSRIVDTKYAPKG